jgi:Transposase DDE domain group 1
VRPVSRAMDRVGVVFDEPGLVADAGLIVVATLVARLGLEALIDATVRFTDRTGGFMPGRKVLTMVHAMIGGATHIGHANRLRAGATGRVVGHRVMAPSTLGTFLRACSFGHVRQLEAVIGESLRRAWSVGIGPGPARLVIDIDSTICQVYGRAKSGAAYGYTKVLGYHPIVAVRADTGEIVHARMRKGSANTARGTKRFVEEIVARARRAGAAGEMVMRFDSGFWSKHTIATLGRLNVRYTMAVRTGNVAVTKAIATIAETAWTAIAYTPDGIAQVAECDYRGRRLIVRRTRLADPAQQALFPTWRHHAFLTDLSGPAVNLDRFHRAHATVELAIRDIKEGSGLAHCPSGNFNANGAWLACAVLAHNLCRWTAIAGGVHPADQLTVAATLRTQLIAMPARLVNHAGTPTLRGPLHWPWADTFTRALQQIRALPAVPG